MSDIEKRIKEKIERVGTPLKEWDINIYRGILTGYNEAFIIDGKTKDGLIEKSPKNAEIIRPILRGRDIKRYGYEFADLWLICTHNGTPSTPPINIDEYPDIKAHLDRYFPQLSDRQDKGCTPYNLRSCIYMDDFSKQKIIWIELTDHPNFALDLNGYYINNTVFFITGKHLKYLTAFLNSKICEWYFDKICATSGVGTRRWIKMYIDQIMIPKISLEQESVIEAIMDNITDNKKISPSVEMSINSLISELFGLSANEFNHVMNAIL